MNAHRRLIPAVAAMALLVACPAGNGQAIGPLPEPLAQHDGGPVDHATAVRLVVADVAGQWTVGTFCVDVSTITYDDEVFVINVGAREFLVDGDDSFAVAGGVPVVDRHTGEVTTEASADAAFRDLTTEPGTDEFDVRCADG